MLMKENEQTEVEAKRTEEEQKENRDKWEEISCLFNCSGAFL